MRRSDGAPLLILELDLNLLQPRAERGFTVEGFLRDGAVRAPPDDLVGLGVSCVPGLEPQRTLGVLFEDVDHVTLLSRIRGIVDSHRCTLLNGHGILESLSEIGRASVGKEWRSWW